MPDPDCERPSYMKRRARQLLFEAARLADASTLGEKIIQIERFVNVM